MNTSAPFGIKAHSLFFGLAIVDGLLSIVLWTLVGIPAADRTIWHAHEMVFGYGLAVVAGFLLMKASPRALLALAVVWSAARLAYWLPDVGSLARAGLSLASTAAIGGMATAGFLRGVKRGSNVVFPLVMLIFPAAEAVAQAGELRLLQDGARLGTWLGLGAVIMLITAMGGRIAGAAVSGAAQKMGGERLAHSAALERAQLIALASGFLLAGLDILPVPAALMLAFGGALLLMRTVFWWPGLRHSPADVIAVVAGQFWLGAGSLIFGLVHLLDLPLPANAPLHLATIGGIGGTTLAMMLRTLAQRDRTVVTPTAFWLVSGLMGVSALLRAFGHPAPEATYVLAALAWSGAFLIAAFVATAVRPAPANGRQKATKDNLAQDKDKAA